jgi:hypothetical protein
MVHNLLRISEKAGMVLNDEQQIFFSTVTGFIDFRNSEYVLSRLTHYT